MHFFLHNLKAKLITLPHFVLLGRVTANKITGTCGTGCEFVCIPFYKLGHTRHKQHSRMMDLRDGEEESCRITCYSATKCKHCNASMSNRIFPAAFRDQHEHSRYSARNENMETVGVYTVNIAYGMDLTAIFNSVIASSVPVRIKETVRRTNRLSLIEHGPHRKRRQRVYRATIVQR
jgi:hypothetical protein